VIVSTKSSTSNTSDPSVGTVHVTLLIEDLRRLAAAVPEDIRYPALERLWSRGRPSRLESRTPNHLRFKLFGIQPEGQLPVAALTHVNDRNVRPRGNYYWLRADPVTMWADMAQVFMTSYGFADLDPYERNEVEICVRDVLQEEGIDLQADHPERWCIALGSPIEFGFTPLDEALGMDVAEALPDHPEARYWRRVLNEVQVALHNCPVNVRRRAMGKREVNSVWFWGGGFIPDAAAHYVLDTVYSQNAVSRGLAIINDCRTKRQSEALESDFSSDGLAVLIDWGPESDSTEDELALLEGLVGRMLKLADNKRLVLTIYEGGGEGRTYGPNARRRFWVRRKPLARTLSTAAHP
jgi:hypothetical protein